MKTVRVPEAMQGLFATAEKLVSRFFRERIDDPAHGTIEIHGERYVLVRAAALSVEFFDLVRSLYAEKNRAEADELSRSLLFDLAHSVGKTDARNFHEKMSLSDPIAKLSAGPIHFAYAGWAFVDIFPESRATPDDEYCMVFDHPYSFESDAWVRAKRTSTMPVCIMNAGYSSGWCEESFGQSLVSAELLCRGKGDEVCRFIMAPPTRIAERIDAYIASHPEIASHVAGYHIPDFFARKREEEALKERQDELERELRQAQKIEALGRLAGGIAHDFNNIIGVVLGQAMLAQRRVRGDNPLAQDLARIIRAAERASSLTQQLLAFGRSQVSRNEVLELNSVVRDMAQMIERVIGDDIEFVLNLSPDTGCVKADRAQLEQVLMNLSVNARDAMPRGGKLTIDTRRFGNTQVELAVADNGVGMDENTRTRAFEPFFTTKGDRGTGLGLSTVYGIITNAGGSIAIESRLNEGSVFRILLPRVVAPVETTKPPAEIPIIGVGTILVVEDRVDLRDLVGSALQAYGFRTLISESVDDALRLLADRNVTIDAIVTDVVMPKMSGVELAGQALKLRPGVRVLFMSGYAPDPEHRALFAGSGAAFLQKPFTPEQLATKVTALLRAAR
ncbi:MAG TPA: ATP-binding protein [Steroidobacteraceae bacterium]|nr:ATP-binding protein [Steroidobacteraceae bacterium]